MSNEILKINANASKGQLEVEILDAETLDPLPNFSFSNCDPIKSDSIDTLVTWKEQYVLNHEKPIRVNFRMQNSDLYSFWTKKNKVLDGQDSLAFVRSSVISVTFSPL